MLWWPDLLWEVELCWDGGKRWLFVAEKIHKEEGEIWEGERRVNLLSSGYKLNIADNIINKGIHSVTSSVIMLITMQRHHAIYLFESHCNSLGIY